MFILSSIVFVIQVGLLVAIITSNKNSLALKIGSAIVILPSIILAFLVGFGG